MDMTVLAYPADDGIKPTPRKKGPIKKPPDQPQPMPDFGDALWMFG